jgi:glycosyltransferase involved in cell wall biosynthesis
VTRSILIHTISARDGGVPQMVEFAVQTLQQQGWTVELAYYQPYSQSPELSTPSFALGRRKPRSLREDGIASVPATALGAWLPELEFTHYWPRREWQQLMDRFDAHLVVSGNALAGTALARTHRRFAAWIATDFDGDRINRVAKFPWPRRLLDRVLNAPVAKQLERQVLRSARVLALSRHTAQQLNRVAGADVVSEILVAPVDTDHFRPEAGTTQPLRVGFSGRLADPRKNLPLLLDALASARSKGCQLTAVLIGCSPSAELNRELEQRQLGTAVRALSYMDRKALAVELRQLDVYALPSHQEGLCIAALEAMASAVPVVSTRCGGPEDYVVDGENGYLVDSDAETMGAAIANICTDRPLRDRMGSAARETVLRDFGKAACAAILTKHVEASALAEHMTEETA